NAIGQIVDDDRREIDSKITKIRWIRRGAFEQATYDSNYNIYWGQTGLVRSWKVDESFATEFRNRISTTLLWTEEFKRFEKNFRNRQGGFDLGYNTREYQSVKTGLRFGRNFRSAIDTRQHALSQGHHGFLNYFCSPTER